ncbi:MAG: Ig-like domain-containing protein [Marinirhabdus sp.]
MKSIYFYYFVLFTSTLFALQSCAEDDDYAPVEPPLPIIAQPDTAEVLQNASVTISIFENDENLPASGTVAVSASSNANVAIVDGSTLPGTTVTYTPVLSFTGTDTFNYTVCSTNGTACATATVTVNVLNASPVNFDIAAVPYATLSEYNFFEGAMAAHQPVFGVLPYKPINELFSDYAKKARYIWMPPQVSATYDGDKNILGFPEGTVIIKTFYYNNVLPDNVRRNIETRLLIKKNAEWVFADYIWDDQQNEAVLDLTGGFTQVDWLQDGQPRSVNYRIPPLSECFTCHKADKVNIPIGPKPQNLNSNYTYPEGPSNQLQKLIVQGYLEDALPDTINTVAHWLDAEVPLRDRVRGYLDINCAHCHADMGHCNYRPIRFSYFESDNDINLGICESAQTPIPGYQKLIVPGDKENSIMYYRMNTVEEQYRMPLLGRRLQHDEGIELVGQWIDSLDGTCD